MTMTMKKTVLPVCLLALAWGLGSAQTPEAAQVLETANPGVIALMIYGQDKAEIAKGSALVLAEDLVATSYHFISKAYSSEGLTSKEKKVKVDGIVAVDKERDLALVKIRGKVTPLALADSAGLAEGAKIFVVGSNESGQIGVSEGTLRRVLDISPGFQIMELAVTVPEPFTGGPILDASGQVIGLVHVLDRGLKVGIPANQWKNLPRTGKATDLKNWNREDYFEILEGAFLMGRVASALDDMLTARIHLENVVKLNPTSIEAQALLANVYNNQRDYTSAAEAYRKVTALDGSNAEAFFGLGGVLLRTSKLPEAIAALEKAVSLGLDKKEVFFELGNAYEQSRNFAKAAESYEKYLAFKPEQAWSAYLQLGLIRMSLEQYDAAAAAFLEAKKDQPQDEKVNANLADAYQKAGQLEKAEEVLTELAGINPQEAKYYLSQALRMYDAAGNPEAALRPARKMVELDPKEKQSLYNLGLMLFKMERYDEAVDVFKQCLALDPDYAYAWFQIGLAYFNQKNYRAAVEPYRKYAELSPDDQFGWQSLGITLMNIAVANKDPKQFEAALEPMQKAVELNPENGGALYNLGIIYVNLKDYLSARNVQKTLEGIDPALADRLRKLIR
jgi:tetratricopeptide (TPR) repeat protein